MKKTLLGLFLGLSVMSMAAGEVHVGENVSGDLHINANVIAPLSIVEKQAMDFGDIVLGEAATSTTTPGIMTVTGAPGNNVIVTVPETAEITRGKSSVTVSLKSNVAKDVAQTIDETTKTLTETIVGTIAAGETKQVGMHTGTVSIAVRYN